jgi:hypothetical protein
MTDKTELDFDHLEAVAKAATAGKWEVYGGLVVHYGEGGREICKMPTDTFQDPEWTLWHNDAAHIAAFDPPTVLALLALARLGVRAEKLEAAVATLRENSAYPTDKYGEVCAFCGEAGQAKHHKPNCDWRQAEELAIAALAALETKP